MRARFYPSEICQALGSIMFLSKILDKIEAAGVKWKDKRPASITDDDIIYPSQLEIINKFNFDRPRLAFIIAANQISAFRGRIKIGFNSIIHSSAVIGAPGQAFERDPYGKLWIMPQFGGVTIKNDCYIGANVTVCRGTIDDTFIGARTRIAHGTQIGHNCIIDEDVFVANGVTIAGSVKIRKGCWIGAGATIRNKITISANTIVGCGAVVCKDIKIRGKTVMGNPARIKENKNGK